MEFFNPWMLLGLAGLIVPVLVHLLARRKQDRVDWGAMQFLEPSPKQRRSLWLENVWLMVLRMSMLAVLAVALARPWLELTWLASWTNQRPQDVALIIDGSASLNRVLNQRTTGDDVHRLARQVLDQLDNSDSVQIYEARESPVALLPGFVRDHSGAKEALLDLPQPTGSANLPAALSAAIRDLLQTGNLDREIVVVTDRQARSWRFTETAVWQSLDALRQQARVPPRIWVLTAGADLPAPEKNIALGPIELSRELAMPGSLVRVSAAVKSYGSPEPTTCEVALEIDGIPAPQHGSTVRVPGQGEAPVEFEIQLDRPGCHAVTMIVRHEDELPDDQRSSAIVEVGSGWPVLLVDQTLVDPPSTRDLYFLHAALDAGNESWIRPTWIALDQLGETPLSDYAAIVLGNLADVPEEQVQMLEAYVQQGGAILITLGGQMIPTSMNEPTGWQAWLPVALEQVAGAPNDPAAAVTLDPDSLEFPWQAPFQRQRTGGISSVRFSQWWQVAPHPTEQASPLVNWASYSHGQPALVVQSRGRGTIAIWTSSMDARWNTFPSKPEYVAWWHEVLFALLEPAVRRNVQVGEPLVVTFPANSPTNGVFLSPVGRDLPGEPWQQGDQLGRRLPAARWPGLYPFVPQVEQDIADTKPQRGQFVTGLSDAFAASSAVEEADLTPLSPEEMESLVTNRPLKFVASAEELGQSWLGDSGRTEISPWLLYLLLGFLVLEVWMTRRMISHGQSRA